MPILCAVKNCTEPARLLYAPAHLCLRHQKAVWRGELVWKIGLFVRDTNDPVELRERVELCDRDGVTQ